MLEAHRAADTESVMRNIRAAYIEVIRLRIAVLDAQLKLLQPRKD